MLRVYHLHKEGRIVIHRRLTFPTAAYGMTDLRRVWILVVRYNPNLGVQS